MWWTLIFGLVLAYPAIEMVEEWRLRRSAEKDLAEMRRRTRLRPPVGRYARSMGAMIVRLRHA